MSTRLLERRIVVPDVFDDLTRRHLLVGSAALGVLGACSRSAVEDEPAGGAASGFPVTIDHQFGSATIPRPPERVISVGLTDHDTLLALGIKPVAVTGWWGFAGRLRQAVPDRSHGGVHREFASVNMPWQEMTRLIGRAVGQGPRAVELVAGVEERFAMTRARYPQFAGASAVPSRKRRLDTCIRQA